MTASPPIPPGEPVGEGHGSTSKRDVVSEPVGTAGIDVFISYNSKDHADVLELAEGLSKRGLKPFLDRWDLAPGLRWRPELERVLASCSSVVVMLGPHGIGEVQQREVDVALRRQDKDPRFPVVPVLLPGGEPPGGFLEQLTWVDLRHQALSDGVGDLAAVLRKEWGTDVQREKARTNRRRYLGNLLLLLAVLGVNVAWYFRHCHTRLGPVALGGSVGLPTLLWLTFLYVRWGAEEEIKSLPRRLLGSPFSTRGLWGALVLSLGLFGATSSVQVEAASTSAEGVAYSVEVTAKGGKRLWQSPSLSTEQRVAIHLFFFRFGMPVELRLQPAGDRGPIRTHLGPAARLRVRVPDQFAPRPVDVLRVLPGSRLVQALGKPGVSVNRVYDLVVLAGDTNVRISDVRRQAMYLAGGEDDIATGLGRERSEDRQGRFMEWARNRLALGEQPARGVVSMWMEPRVVGGWVPPASLDGIRFDLMADGDAVAEPLSVVVWDGTNGIRTVVIDRKP